MRNYRRATDGEKAFMWDYDNIIKTLDKIQNVCYNNSGDRKGFNDNKKGT